ncbi:SAV_915 family protein [Saccharopolyspora mangrovi]|uniref:SAV_915 family protein n=1 Tax=Saccharopolyspora mangrovi TaxID=3082379 RepID=A0ABU6AK75_9PSEU|nr:SAV_915 family protein [Saccharopolyspora sp. S2-29]MEB3371931.1 SAV_915 family protein [Saccharopolyspora sp. S2-29]
MRAGDDAAPAVIGADYIAEQNGEEPEPVYLPLEKPLTSSDADATISMRELEDGRVAILVYTSLESLVVHCGDLQPWASVLPDQLGDIQARSGADMVAWDEPLPPEQRSDSAGGDQR